MIQAVSRREFLGASLGAAAASVRAAAPLVERSDVSFFLVADTHYLADRSNTGRLDRVSAETNARLIDVLNELPGSVIPEAAGGGRVASVRGVIHAGDCIDSGDKNGKSFLDMQQTEWRGFVGDYGLSGRDGRLKYPVYEVHGNHDSPPGDGLVVKQIGERNKSRVGVSNVSGNGVHYSWDWGRVHFVNLGIVVGTVKDVVRRRRYDPLDSLDFLVADLAAKVGTSGRPVILTHHVDVARYSTAVDPKGPATNAEWDPADVRGYYEALRAYNVVAILYGHTHARATYQWEGTTKKGEKGGVSVYNVAKSGHFSSKAQAAFYFTLRDAEMVVRELTTTDRWETRAWTPRTWTKRIAMGK